MGKPLRRGLTSSTARRTATIGKEDVELPLKMLVMVTFTGRPDDRPIEKRDPVAINGDISAMLWRKLQGIAF